jgi:hypothetical protein
VGEHLNLARVRLEAHEDQHGEFHQLLGGDAEALLDAISSHGVPEAVRTFRMRKTLHRKPS